MDKQREATKTQEAARAADTAPAPKGGRLSKKLTIVITLVLAALLLLGLSGGLSHAYKLLSEKIASLQGGESSVVTGELQVHFIDVGQGDCMFIELPDGKSMLIDAGPTESAQNTVTYIKSLGYKKIDYIIATHPHSDHIGGMAAIIDTFKIGEIWAPQVEHSTPTYEKFLKTIKRKGLTIHRAVAGSQIYASDDCSLDILYPAQTSYPNDLNDWSIVCILEYGSTSFLFTGDVRTSITSEVCSKKIDVLKVGHHGSYTSTSSALIKKLQPSHAVISCEIDNSYGYPHDKALSALKSVAVYRTDLNGTVVAASNGNAISLKTER